MKIAVVIPSARGPKCLESFIEIATSNVDFIILSEKKLEKKYERTTEFNDKEIFEKSWIFNRHTKRNFGFAYAYKQNYDVMITLDDDCFPISNTYFHDHISKLKDSANNYFNILNLFSNMPKNVLEKGARGFPKEIQKKFPIVLNQGLWQGDLDLSATTIVDILRSRDGKIPPPLSTESMVINDFVIPKNQLTTVCGMNVSFLREVVPVSPWLYQEPDGDGIARYDDIWGGLICKVILDKLEKRMSAGSPLVLHDKGRRDMSIDLKWEHNGNAMNNFLWNNLPNLILEGKDYTSCFLEIADWLAKASDNPDRVFFKKVSKAMQDWIKFLDSKF